MNNSTKKIDIKGEPWFTITTFASPFDVNEKTREAVYEDVSDYSLGGGFLGMKFKDGSSSYLSLEYHRIHDIDVAIHE